MLLLFVAACSGGGGAGGIGPGNPNTGNAQLTRVVYGRLADIYGLRTTPTGVTVELYQTDVMLGPDIQDERPTNSTLRDSEILYDFIGTNPDNLQARVLITRELGSAEFEAGFTALGSRVRDVAAGLFGQDVSTRPFTVVPRNAALKLVFSQSLDIDESFFVVRDANGRITGIRNTEAVQLLEIQSDPRDGNPVGDFRVIPTRIVPRGNELIIDPVLLGSEGPEYQVRNNASGLPNSADQLGANIRLAVAVEGPLRIRGVAYDANSPYLGTNNQNLQSVIRDFRSGNSADDSADIARGFVRDPERPRIVGQMRMYLASAEQFDSKTQVVRLYKGTVVHKVDLGDVVRVIDPSTGTIFGAGEILADPEDPVDAQGIPTESFVRCVIRNVPGLPTLDPRNLAGYPGNVPGLGDWLVANAPRAVLIAEFTASRLNPATNTEFGDNPVNFLTFSPTPLPLASGLPSPSNQNISPFAEAIIRFTKPVDMTTVRPHDSFFFATRNVLDPDAVFGTPTSPGDPLLPATIDRARVTLDKYATPHLVASRVIDEDGSQTSVRLQTQRGLYLDEEMRVADEPLAFADKRFRYFLHLVAGNLGIRDLTGNPVDFQALSAVSDYIVVPFSLDTRKDSSGTPFFADNLAVSVVRRHQRRDEDEQPSLYIPAEAPRVDAGTGNPLPTTPEGFAVDDIFGAVSYLEGGLLQARATSRARKIVDDINQLSPAPQSTIFRFCPLQISSEAMLPGAGGGSATVRFGQGIQNPLNPFGCRLQTVWREIDLSLSRLDPTDFNLDVEQMWWAPFTNSAITYDYLDQTSLFLGHSEKRPEPCIGSFSSLPELPNSGLGANYADNYLHNRAIGTGARQDAADPFTAYVDKPLVIDQVFAVFEPNGVNRFLPLPTFQKPYFVYRDETVVAQGSASGRGSDQPNANQVMPPYLLSPFLGGFGRYVYADPQNGGALTFSQGAWYNLDNYKLNTARRSTADAWTGGLVAAVASPLLADFWTYCDDPDLPAGNGFLATGFNGWQIALSVQSAPQPNFRSFSAGFAGTPTRRSVCVSPGTPAWNNSTGGYTPTGGSVPGQDNSVYWTMVDFLKRQTVVTAGFVDIFNPHRMAPRTPGTGDPRLGPYLIDAGGNSSLPLGWLPAYAWNLDPPAESLPGGTAVLPEFRAAGPLDTAPWAYGSIRGGFLPPRTGAHFVAPDVSNFPLDPLKAGDAHIRKYDDRPLAGGGGDREWWTYFYNKNITAYTREIGDLQRDTYLAQFAGPNDRFLARDVRYVNWRFLMRNNVESNPAVSPTIDSFALTFRFERQR
ncbi:MAG: hypothetical protein IT457_10215 [Planctomycetes bacterium]|nr:hypothetical protein [Planctomycetota bacterium]